jgi:hypothetical protein
LLSTAPHDEGPGDIGQSCERHAAATTTAAVMSSLILKRGSTFSGNQPLGVETAGKILSAIENECPAGAGASNDRPTEPLGPESVGLTRAFLPVVPSAFLTDG